jgi:hypothetical protein
MSHKKIADIFYDKNTHDDSSEYLNEENISLATCEKNLTNAGKNLTEKSPIILCDFSTDNNTQKSENVIISLNDKMDNLTKNSPINKMMCEKCDYSCNKLSDWTKHISTKKHKRNCDDSVQKHICENCGKCYKIRQSLHFHQKTCLDNVSNKNVEEELLLKEFNKQPVPIEILLHLIKENKEFQMLMFEHMQKQNEQMNKQNDTIASLAKTAGNHNNNNTMNNSNNKSFNLQIFLNETCKNALNLSEFLGRVVVSLDDLEQTGRLGYVEGISRIFGRELNKLDVSERPIHCSDAKRETIYIKENDKWEKESDDREQLKNAIRHIGKLNIGLLGEWRSKNPGWRDCDSKENDRYLMILGNSMCGGTDEEIVSNYSKIVKNISVITTVDKAAATAMIS